MEVQPVAALYYLGIICCLHLYGPTNDYRLALDDPDINSHRAVSEPFPKLTYYLNIKRFYIFRLDFGGKKKCIRPFLVTEIPFCYSAGGAAEARVSSSPIWTFSNLEASVPVSFFSLTTLSLVFFLILFIVISRIRFDGSLHSLALFIPASCHFPHRCL